MRAALRQVQDPRHGRVDLRSVSFSRSLDAPAARRELLAHVPFLCGKREEIRVFPRHGADGQEPHIVGGGEFEAGISHLAHIVGIRDFRLEKPVLRRIGLPVRSLVLDQFGSVDGWDLHAVPRHEDWYRVRVPAARILAALERPAHAVRVVLHPIDVEPPGGVRRVAQREHVVVLGTVGVGALVLVVVGAEFILGER